jgi:predicted phage terminase large subunit-like protein
MSSTDYQLDQEEIEKYLPLLRPEEAHLIRAFTKPDPRNNLLDFTAYTYPGYKPEAVHSLISMHLDALVLGDIDKLIVTMQPQIGKSELCSVRFPAYWLAKRPDDPVILCSYGSSLAEDKSRQVRELVQSDEFLKLFPDFQLRKDSLSVQLWKLDGHKGQLLAAGVGGPITGQPAKLGLIDDFFENWEAAVSKNNRDKIWDWYRSTFRVRLHEGSARLIVATRWHQDDLIGRILNSPGSNEWTVLRIPALAETQEERDKANKQYNLPPGREDPLGREPGEPASPKRFSKPYMLEMKRDVGTLVWNAEYQGAPSALEGLKIKRDWFRFISPGDPTFVEVTVQGTQEFSVRWVRYWDKAGTDESEDRNADYTVGVLMAYDTRSNTTYIVDVVRGQWNIFKRNKIMLETAMRDAAFYGKMTTHIWHEQEPGSAGKDAALLIDQMLRAYPVYHETSTGSKEVRAQAFTAHVEGRNVVIVQGEWNEAYLDELAAFPSGEHDDQVDATSGAYNKLALFKPPKELEAF